MPKFAHKWDLTMEFTESLSNKTPFSYENDDIKFMRDDSDLNRNEMGRELSVLERPTPIEGEVDFYGMGADICEDEDEETWALGEDLKKKREIELKSKNRPSPMDAALATASPRTKSRLSKLRDGAILTVVKARSDLARTVSDLGSKLKGALINKETENTWKDVVTLFTEQLQDVPKIDFILGSLLLSMYYKENPKRTNMLVTDKAFAEESTYFYKFAYGAYGWKALYGRRRGAKRHIQGLAVKARDGFTQANTDALISHTGLLLEDIVDKQWNSVNFSPGHYVALDHKTKNIIVAIRGTSHMHDFLVDLCGRNEPFMGGFVHSGILRCAQNKAKRFIPLLEKLLEKFTDYSIKVVGHSLGGGTAALLTIILVTEKPQWPIMGYCYASPCVVSKNLGSQFSNKIYSYAVGNDPITRVSLGSMEALKNTIIQLTAQSETTLQRMFHVVNAGKTLGADVSKKIAGWLKVKGDVDITKVNMQVSVAEKLIPPGRLFHLYKQNPSDAHYVMEESDHDFFTEIIISNDMVQDHFPTMYEVAWKNLLENPVCWGGKTELSINSPEL